ncbi:MAG: phosphoribosylaminoimidazolesuccinocarboxamide synthase [Terriglobia bacterium]
MVEKRAKLYEGKAKIIYDTDEAGIVISSFKEAATAFDGKKKDEISGKGAANAQISAVLFKVLEAEGVKTHFKELVSDHELATIHLDMLGVEVVVRNIAAGSLAKRLGYSEGTRLKAPVVEFYYKNDDLGDPLLTRSHIGELGLATASRVEEMRAVGLRVNEVLLDFFARRGMELVDFKLEFGMSGDDLVLADEISPDTCRLWDVETGQKLDKDRFRRDLGGVGEAYQEVLRRVGSPSP